ncbi:hypothetical protein MtrunA17_Chr1g0200451 [Medicago truncatula]|uniref:Uncharacterized protein n=1 Tax=Medicago truncatula TaxID=3880 RepID=I3SKW4_MEDTR|nr:unknown [Medicago truncatula]RHN81556.1 hypothetical protein MtrunA17_Chr1g0200451 [Medicago truncatula]
MSALSDSTTTTLSPLESLSPSDLIHETILPSVIVELSAGMKISRILARTMMRFVVRYREVGVRRTTVEEERKDV